MTTPPPPWKRTLRVYLESLAVERGLSQNTVDAYRNDLTRLGEALALKGADGRSYTYRPLLKDASGLLPVELRESKARDFVIDQMHGAYPELEAQRGFIGKMVRLEEERFGNTLTVGLKKLSP